MILKHFFRNLNNTRQRTLCEGNVSCHGRIVFEKAVNKPGFPANTKLRFTIVSLFGGLKFLSEMLP